MPTQSLTFELLFGGIGLFCGALLLNFGIGVIRDRKTRQEPSALHPPRKCAPKYGSQYERQWHEQLLEEFEDNARNFLEAIYAQRQIYGEPWFFYRRAFTTLLQGTALLGFLVLLGVLFGGWVQDDLLGTSRHMPHFPAWLEHLSEFFMWLAAGLVWGDGFLSLLKHSTILRFIGLHPKPWMVIDRTGITLANRHIPWDTVAGISTTTTYATFNGARSYDVLIRLKDENQKVVITPPGDLVHYLPMPRWQSIGGTMAAQFCLLALLYYCFRFHWVHDCESRQTDSEN